MANTWLRNATVNAGQKVVWALDNYYGGASKVGDKPFFDEGSFPWVETVEGEWRLIRKELDEVLRYRDELPNFQEISPDQVDITQDDQWKTFFFYAYGEPAEGNLERCPETARILKKIPGMKTAFFSIMGPNKHIPPHRGPYKGVLRYHLGLKIPDVERCGIRVADEVGHWQEGKSLVFDDAFEHEAWNKTDEDRVVLFVDFVRPMRWDANALNTGLIKLIKASPYVSGSKGNYLAWEERFEKIVNEQP